MGLDFAIYDDIKLYGDELTQELRLKISEWIDEHRADEFFHWNLDLSNEDCIIISLLKFAKGDAMEYIEGLVPLFKLCANYSFYVQDSIPYMLAWGDSESGAIYISSSDDEILVKIVGIASFGNVRSEEKKW